MAILLIEVSCLFAFTPIDKLLITRLDKATLTEKIVVGSIIFPSVNEWWNITPSAVGKGLALATLYL